LVNADQYSIVQTLDDGVKSVGTLLQRLEHTYHLPVALLVIPLFALVNAGVAIDFDSFGSALKNPVALGVIAGLVAGKLIGITGICWIALKLGIGNLPEHTEFRHIVGVSLLAGIGFTMSNFLAELAFAATPENLLMAKTGILLASLIASVCGYVWLRFAVPRQVSGN
jgi:NhaA family Na+:H+ antiporter